MRIRLNPNNHSAQAAIYQIRLQGQLDSQWEDWFGEMTITLEANGDTCLTGQVVDQAALHGLLKRIRDLGLPLISVNRIQTEATHPFDSRKEQDMHTNAETTRPEETKVAVRLKLSALWAAMMFLYVYGDIYSLFRPGVMEEMMAGRMGPFPVTQASLMSAAVLVIIPAVMVFLSLALRSKAARWTSIVLGVLYALVNVSNLIGETWAYYIVIGVVELAITLLIVGYAWKWRNLEGQPG